MKCPAEVKLSREDGEALRQRLAEDALTAADRHVLDQVLQWYFWLLFALQEATFSLKRLRVLLFGEKPKQRKTSHTDQAWGSQEGDGRMGAVQAGGVATAASHSSQETAGTRRPGHGRWGSEAYSGAARVECRHEELAAGERCPVCGRGRLYHIGPGVEMRLDGHALLSAVRYMLEKLRCSACGQVFTARPPEGAGQEKYSAGHGPCWCWGATTWGFRCTGWKGIKRWWGCRCQMRHSGITSSGWRTVPIPCLNSSKNSAAQGEVISQDDTHVRILSLMAENRQAQADDTSERRTGMYTTALVAQQGTQTICLYVTGRAHAGENLEALLTHREEDREKPLVMSDALASNAADETALIRCHCLAHGRRQFTELEETFPDECAVVIGALKQVFDHEEEARVQQMSAEARLGYHQQYSGPIMEQLKHWLDAQFEERTVEPNSSLGKAFQYLLTHWQTLTRFLEVPGAPLENNTAERALKLAIRQRKNSLFYATDYSAYIASMLTSLIATCLHAGVNALEYLVALQEHRAAVFRDPSAWLPWHYHANLVPL